MKWPIKTLIIVCVLFSCAMLNHQKIYPLPEGDVTVVDNKIYHNEKLIAELRYLGKRDWCAGLSIFYYQHNKEVWIFPEEGWHVVNIKENKKYSTIPEIKEQLSKATTLTQDGKLHTDFTMIRYLRGNRDVGDLKVPGGAFDIRLSSDGKYVHYKTKGALFTSSHTYLVEYGVSK